MKRGNVLSVCVSPEKGTKKNEVCSAQIITNWGIKGDAHAGPWHRQVSILSIEDIELMKTFMPTLRPGDFAENVVIQGLNTDHAAVGDKISIGDDIILVVSQIGKECHSGCEIQKLTV